MPIDSKLRKEYFKEYMRSRRTKLKGVNELDLKVNTVNTLAELTPQKNVNTSPPVNTQEKALTPELVKPVKPCPLNHHSLSELFQQATEKIRQDYKVIYQDPDTARKCFNCHNLQRNYQIMLKLLEKYWKLSKKGANHG